METLPSYDELYNTSIKSRVNSILSEKRDNISKQKVFITTITDLLKNDINKAIEINLPTIDKITIDDINCECKIKTICSHRLSCGTVEIDFNCDSKIVTNLINENMIFFIKNKYYCSIEPKIFDSLKDEENIIEMWLKIEDMKFSVLIGFEIKFVFDNNVFNFGKIKSEHLSSLARKKLVPIYGDIKYSKNINVIGFNNTINKKLIKILLKQLNLMKEDICKKMDDYICKYISKNKDHTTIKLSTIKMLDNYSIFSKNENIIKNNRFIKPLYNPIRSINNIDTFYLYEYVHFNVVKYYINENFTININRDDYKYNNRYYEYHYNWSFNLNI
jgi:hypothetical protein